MDPDSYAAAIVQSLTAAEMVLIMGLLLNGNWLYTAFSMILVISSTIIYFAVHVHFVDVIEMCMAAFMLCVLSEGVYVIIKEVFAIYSQEYRDKLRFT